MKQNSSTESVSANHSMPSPGGPGPFQPPRNRVTAMAQIAITFMNSPRKNIPNFMLEYSVWNPATSSASASGRSNGARLVSANAVSMKMMKASGWDTKNHPGLLG